MDWKLDSIFKGDRINQTTLAEVLVQEQWTTNRVKGVIKTINEHCHDFQAFVRRRDVLRWYYMYRSYLNVSPMELTGLKTDQEAVTELMKAKLQRYLDEQGVDIKIKDLVIDDVPKVESVAAHILDQYVGKPMRKSV
jgi:hypothetical protein